MVNITKKDDGQSEERGLARVSPFSLFDQLLDDNFFDPFRIPSLIGARTLGRVATSFPKVDVSETNTEIKVVANIPGIDPEKVDVEIGDDYLSLSGKLEKEVEDKDAKGKVYRYEREYGEFRRSFTLPARVNKEKIVAKAKNGVLTLTLPKSEEEKHKKIKIEVEK